MSEVMLRQKRKHLNIQGSSNGTHVERMKQAANLSGNFQ